MSQPASLVGSVFERKPTSTPKAPTAPAGRTGFPTVAHRTKSAFSRRQEELKRTVASPERVQDVPFVRPTNFGPPPNTPSGSTDGTRSRTVEDDWRKQISDENEKKVAMMSEEELEEERREILERFGGGVGDVLKRAAAKRKSIAGVGKPAYSDIST